VVGVGIALGVDREISGFKIMQVIPGGPAARAGLPAGLIVEKVDGVSLKGKNLNECVTLMRGAVGSKVTLQLVDPAEQTTNKVELTRERIVVAGQTAAKARLGDRAARLAIKDWVKGKPVDVRDGKAVYVVEFWATWCGPCRISIPHLTELQKQWKDKGVVVVGVSDEPAATVRPLVEKMADKMDYTVACDDNRITYSGYMDAYGFNGIPTAFIVGRDGRVLWHGHPMNGLDGALEQAVVGKLEVPPSAAPR
jgi:thiol-disulfide isomerase/thioredoxin